MSAARLGFAVTTLGRPALRGLLRSLAEQEERPAWVGVADQSAGPDVARLVDEFRDVLPLETCTTGRGASIGRNAVAALAPGTVSHLVFPNDTSRYPRTFVAEVARLVGDVDVVCTSYVDEAGPRRALPRGTLAIDRRTAWYPIEPAMVVRRDAFDAVGGLAPDLGTGAPSPWQSSGGGDLLLRISAARAAERRTATMLVLPELEVAGVTEGHGLSAGERRWKARAYGRGYGRVLRRNGYPLHRLLASVGAAALLGLRDPRRHSVAEGALAAVGRLEGVTGLAVGGRARTAVDR